MKDYDPIFLEAVLEWCGVDTAVATGAASLVLNLQRPPEGFQELLRACQSPIEREFLLAVLHQDLLYEPSECSPERRQLAIVRSDVPPEKREVFAVLNVQPSVDVNDVELHPDFIIVQPAGPSLVVELDGHEWHERTREQAANDRERDRWLTAATGPVVRFTGSEVHRDPVGCLAEALEILEELGHAEGQRHTHAPERCLPCPEREA